MMTSLHRDRRLLAVLGSILALVFFIAFNIWADRALRGARLDLTSDGIYTISDGTRGVLASVREPITLRLYVSDGLDAMGPDYVALEKRVGELLQEYARMAKGKIRIERLDPKAFSPEEDLAVADGIQSIPNTLDGTQIFLGLAGTNSTNGRYVIPHLAPERGAFLEYDLTRLIHDLANPKKSVVALYGDLPLNGDRTQRQRPWAVLDAVERFFSVRTLFGSIGRFEDDIDIVWLAEPGELDEITLYALDQFVMRGGRVLAFVDPLSEVMAASQPRGPSAPRRTSLEALEPVLSAWGVTVPPRHVVGDRPGSLKVRMRKNGRTIVTDYLAWFEVKKHGFAADDLVTGNLALVEFRTAGQIKRRDGATTTIEPLIRTSDQASEIDLSKVEYAPDPTIILSDFKPAGKRYVLAARVSGPVKSAFPDGPPEALKDEAIRAAHRAEAEVPLALILAADTDMLADVNWVEMQNLGGQGMAVPFANNGDFVVNALDQLSGSDAMIGLRGRGIADRRFVVLEAMAQQAEQRYRAKERELLGKIEAIKKEIVDLQKTEQEQGVILTTEQQSAIDRSRGEMLDLRRELRDVQFALRRDVEDLKSRITALNIWSVPVLIGLFALLFAAWRGWRARAYRGAGA